MIDFDVILHDLTMLYVSKQITLISSAKDVAEDCQGAKSEIQTVLRGEPRWAVFGLVGL